MFGTRARASAGLLPWLDGRRLGFVARRAELDHTSFSHWHHVCEFQVAMARSALSLRFLTGVVGNKRSICKQPWQFPTLVPNASRSFAFSFELACISGVSLKPQAEVPRE